MKNIIKNLLIILAILMLSPLPALAATTTNDQLFDPCNTNSLTKNSPICKDKNTTTNPVNDKIRVAANIVALATGVAAIIFIILGGITMITSAGNPEAVANARKRIFYAVIGLVIVALAWTIVAFVTDKFIK
jgi:predicted small integral membrane protein